MFNFVPKANFDEAATVIPAVALAPEAVIPLVLPQHFVQGQYAVILYISVPLPLGTFAVLSLIPDLDVTTFLFT